MQTYFARSITLFLAVLLQTAPCRAQTDLPALMPEELEIELALSALPIHLREDASVYVLRRGGYKQTVSGTNGFSCLVRRSGAVPGPYFDAVVPICYDKEGSETLLPAMLDEVKLLEAGQSVAQVADKIKAAWAEGLYRVPGPGIAYMLSPVFKVTTSRGVGSYIPHIMFYGPYKSNTDIGASGDRMGPMPFIQGPGLPGSMMVVPLGEKEREAIIAQEEELIQKVAPYLE